MNTGFYKKLANPLGLAVLDLVDYYGQGLIITRINTPAAHRRKGIATELLTECCREADRDGIVLWLEIAPSGEMSFTDLADWYREFGFRYWRGVYRRMPNAQPRPVEPAGPSESPN